MHNEQYPVDMEITTLCVNLTVHAKNCMAKEERVVHMVEIENSTTDIVEWYIQDMVKKLDVFENEFYRTNRELIEKWIKDGKI